jgi:hypothetical protein
MCYAVCPVRRWLSRLWLATVALSAVFAVVLWIGVMTERLGWRLVGFFTGLALLSRFAARKPTDGN